MVKLKAGCGAPGAEPLLPLPAVALLPRLPNSLLPEEADALPPPPRLNAGVGPLLALELCPNRLAVPGAGLLLLPNKPPLAGAVEVALGPPAADAPELGALFPPPNRLPPALVWPNRLGFWF